VQKINFTKDSVERLKPTKSRYVVGDTKIAGLILRVGPTGIKSYQVYKKLKGKPKRITLGRTTELTVEMARNKAKKIIGEMAYSGTDHNADKRLEHAKSVTLNEVYEDYQAASNLRPNTLAGYKLAVDRDFKDWKDKSLSKITGLMVQQRHKKLGKESETSANKAMRVLRALYNFARDQYENSDGHSLFPDNPTRKLKRQWNRESRRKGHIAKGQLKDWFEAVQKLPETNKRGHGACARDYLVFILLTGLRRREATSLLWRDIDLKARRFIVRDPKNHDDLWMPISGYLLDMLEELKKSSKGDHPFPIEEPRKFIQKVRDDSEVYFTIHDLRRTFITIAESLDIGVYTIKTLVNHRTSQNDVTEGYVQINTERLRKPMERITNFILTAGGIRKSASIVDLNKDEKQA
jgi:integrase